MLVIRKMETGEKLKISEKLKLGEKIKIVCHNVGKCHRFCGIYLHYDYGI
jgi:hypothetical protein